MWKLLIVALVTVTIGWAPHRPVVHPVAGPPPSAAPPPPAISMEGAAMQLDCTQPTSDCYRQIARHFEADRLLWAEIERAAKGKKKKSPTIIRIVLFDVERGAVIGRAEQSFPGTVSSDALDQLLSRALAPTASSLEAGATRP